MGTPRSAMLSFSWCLWHLYDEKILCISRPAVVTAPLFSEVSQLLLTAIYQHRFVEKLYYVLYTK